ncbi:unnamed protein product, partial [Didymodactylos carnosus]
MPSFSEIANPSNQNIDIQGALLNRLKELHQKFPERFSKPIDVLASVDGNVDGQWKQRLQQARKDQNGERIALIPYNLGNFHWIGVLIKFKADGQIECAEFIDPVEESNFIPDKLQKQFTEVFPDAILRSRTCPKPMNRKSSALLTIVTLLKAVEEPELTAIECPNTDYLHIQIVNDQQTSTVWLETNNQIGRKKKQALQRQLYLKDASELLVKVPQIEQQIKQYEKRDRYNDFKNEMESLDELRESQIVTENVYSLISDASICETDNRSKLESYEALKKQLQDSLAEHDISNEEELEQLIIKKKQENQFLKNAGKHKFTRKRQDSLELEQLHLLVDKVKALKLAQSNNDYEALKTQLDSGLADHDISNEEELEKQIIEKKQKIQFLKHEGKFNIVRKRENSLSELEELQLLVDKIKALKPSNSIIGYEMPKEQIEDDHLNNDPMDRWKQEECPITKESLSNMYKDFCSMPSCSERSIISLLYYVSLRLANNSIVLDQSIVVPDRIEIEIENELVCLKERLKIEELASLEIRNSVEEVVINIKDENWKSTLIPLRKIFKEISPLNMQEMFRLVEKVDNTAQLIKNKDIIFFLGGTGSGKSTTIHFLAGSKMVEKKLKGLNHIAPVEIKNSDLKYITTSPFSRSETRYITPVNVNFEEVGGYNSGSIILCDSPGFEDTSGPEVDIANGIGIVKAIKGCKSVKPVVLVSYKSIGDRFEGLKNLTHMLVGLISGIQDHIKAFSYIFTKYPLNERNTIHASLENIRKAMNDGEKSDKSFMNFFTDMLHKTEDGAQVIDPINDKPGKILDKLAESTAIHYPDEVFQFSITEKSKATVQEQVRKHQLSIMSATKRYEYLLVKHKLDQLERLKDLLSQEYIEQIYNECVQHISRHLSEDYEQSISAFNRCLMNQTVLSNEDVKQYQARIDHAKLAAELSKHLEKKVIHSSAFIQYLNQQVDIMIEDLREKDIDD